MTTQQQPDALRLADECEESATNWLHEIDTRAKAAKMLRRLHAESEQHLQELRSYRITVENREARIAELEAQLAAAQQARVPLSDELPQGFLSDVLTAAGLVSHGKQCKALGSRIGEAVEAIWKISIQQREAISAHGITPSAPTSDAISTGAFIDKATKGQAMTQTTDQERAEFEAWCDSNEYDRVTRLDGSGYNNEKTKRAWLAWQASRRAQVVPQGWSLQDAAQDALDWLEDEDLNMTHNIRERLRFALAAAPQPPEPLKRENPATKTQENSAEFDRIEAAPVPKLTHAAKRKLDLLQGNGATITGYAIEKDGRRGAIDCHGFVYWWNDAAVPQQPACNPSMQPELAAEAAAEHKALRSVYEAARGLLRYEGVDDGRAITYRTKLNNAIEDVKQIDGGLWEPPEAAQLDDIDVADMAQAVDSKDATPVQMPESISKVFEDCRSRAIDYATCPSPYNNTRLETAFQSLEHQVRQLLAQHGIK